MIPDFTSSDSSRSNRRVSSGHSKFTPREDEQLREAVRKYNKNWTLISQTLENRTARQCRDRWNYYLCPDTNLEDFTSEDDDKLMSLYNQYGSKWSIIAPHFSGRTTANVRNRILKLLRRQARGSRSPPTSPPKDPFPQSSSPSTESEVSTFPFYSQTEISNDDQVFTLREDKRTIPDISSVDKVFFQQLSKQLSF